MAKPTRTKKNGFQGQFEAFNLVNFVLFQGRAMVYVNHCDIVETFPHIRKEFNRISLMSYFFDLIIKSTSLGQNQDRLFDLLVETLRKANDLSLTCEGLTTEFHTQFLHTEGLHPSLNLLVDEEEFCQIFEHYTGRKVQKPTQIRPV